MLMQAELIFTGSELLLGYVLNTHAQYLGRRLSEMGIEVILHTTVGDNWDRLAMVLRQALERSELIITTGGLGPTTDDLTKETVAGLLGLPMVLDEDSLAKIKAHFADRGITMPESITKQAYIPKGSHILSNPRGTAPGILIEKNNKTILMLPGPPSELVEIFESSLTPYLSGWASRNMVIRHRIYKLTGIAESVVQDQLKDLGRQGNPGIAYLVMPGEVQVRITAKANNAETAEKMVSGLAEKVQRRLGGYIFGYNEEVLEEVVGKLLLEAGFTVGVAESCTGGLIAARLTGIPGSSAYLKGGVVAYSNSVKQDILGVSSEILRHYGAVSKQTAVIMAEGIRRLVGTDLGLAVTGIAGPEGGSPLKPVGLVYICLAADDGTCCREYRFPGARPAIRQGTANAAMNLLRHYLLAR